MCLHNPEDHSQPTAIEYNFSYGSSFGRDTFYISHTVVIVICDFYKDLLFRRGPLCLSGLKRRLKAHSAFCRLLY